MSGQRLHSLHACSPISLLRQIRTTCAASFCLTRMPDSSFRVFRNDHSRGQLLLNANVPRMLTSVPQLNGILPIIPDSENGELRTMTQLILDVCEVRPSFISMKTTSHPLPSGTVPFAEFVGDGSLCISCHSGPLIPFVSCCLPDYRFSTQSSFQKELRLEIKARYSVIPFLRQQGKIRGGSFRENPSGIRRHGTQVRDHDQGYTWW